MKRQPLRLLAALLTLCLLVSGGVIGAFAADATAAPEATAGAEPATEAEAEAAVAAEPVSAPVSNGSDVAAATAALLEYVEAGDSYPDNYAGCYASDSSDGESTLHIVLTTDNQGTRQSYLDLMGNPDCVEFHTGAYNLNQLLFYQELGMSLTGAHTAYPDVEYNRVILAVDQSAVYAAWDALHAGVVPAALWGKNMPLPKVDDVFLVQAGEPVAAFVADAEDEAA